MFLNGSTNINSGKINNLLFHKEYKHYLSALMIKKYQSFPVFMHKYEVTTMKNKQFFEDLSNKIRDMAQNSPLSELDKNFHALLEGAFTKLELVTKTEFDVQAEVLRLTRQKLEELEKKLDEIETMLQKNNK